MPVVEGYRQGTPCWIELVTPDVDGAARFYGDLFGWATTAEPGVGGERGLLATLRGYAVAGIAAQGPEIGGHPGSWSVYLATDDLDAVTERVGGAGGSVEAGPLDAADRGRTAVVEDPTGALVGLWQAGDRIGTAVADEPGAPVWHELVTGDVARATGFYADLLGVGVQPSTLPRGGYTLLTDATGRPVGGVLPPPMRGMPPHWRVYLEVDDVDETGERAVELGGRVVAPAFDVPGVGRIAVLADPQGAVLDVMTPEPPAPE